MYPVVLGSPPAGPPVPVRQWQGMRIIWTGPDGSVWDLTDPDGGVVLVRDGVEGLHFPRVDKHTTQSRAFPGHRIRGWQTTARDVLWKVYIWADGTNAWLDRITRFFATIHPENEGIWSVQVGDRPARTLRLTGVFEESHSYESDPTLRGWQVYSIALEAAQPYWLGERVRRGPWESPTPVDFFPDDGAPEFRISSSANFATAAIPNVGDVDAYGVWWVRDALAQIELGVGDTLIRPPFDLVDGQMLRIDTDPRNPTAQLGAAVDDTGDFVGDDVTRQLGLQDYARIPPGASVPLHVAAVGTGAVMFDLTPLHFRAF